MSDKLAIIHQGSLLASGTVSELKKQFGNSGFELTINLKENQSPDEMEIHVKNSVSNAAKLPKRHRKGKTKIIFKHEFYSVLLEVTFLLFFSSSNPMLVY